MFFLRLLNFIFLFTLRPLQLGNLWKMWKRIKSQRIVWNFRVFMDFDELGVIWSPQRSPKTCLKENLWFWGSAWYRRVPSTARDNNFRSPASSRATTLHADTLAARFFPWSENLWFAHAMNQSLAFDNKTYCDDFSKVRPRGCFSSGRSETQKTVTWWTIRTLRRHHVLSRSNHTALVPSLGTNNWRWLSFH